MRTDDAQQQEQDCKKRSGSIDIVSVSCIECYLVLRYQFLLYHCFFPICGLLSLFSFWRNKARDSRIGTSSYRTTCFNCTKPCKGGVLSVSRTVFPPSVVCNYEQNFRTLSYKFRNILSVHRFVAYHCRSLWFRFTCKKSCFFICAKRSDRSSQENQVQT